MDCLWRQPRAQYRDGKLYGTDGKELELGTDEKFATTVLGYLNKMNGTDLGKKVLGEMSSSENVYNYTNEYQKDESGRGVPGVMFEANKDNKGGTMKVGYLMSGANEAALLEGVSHETFHGYQQLYGETKNDVAREVGAYIFGQAMVQNVYGFNLSDRVGIPTKDGQKFRENFTQALNSQTFNEDAFKGAVNTFKSGSVWQNPAPGRSGPYGDLSKKFKNKEIALKRLYPLIK